MPLRSFDRLARPYHLLEYLTFGPLLRRTREHFLPALGHSRKALVLGDGDGRFLHALLRANPHLQAVAVDASRRMLELLTRRSRHFAPRLTATQADLCHPLPPSTHAPFDLVATHFFLDCLSTSELRTLVSRIRPTLTPDALWVLSEFRIPRRGALRPLAQLLVRGLYLAFRILTGLRTSRLPDYTAVLEEAGFHRLDQALPLGGLLSAELWRRSTPN